jgi:hypothetical protein
MRKPRINRGYKEPAERIPEPVIDQRVIDQRTGRSYAEVESEMNARTLAAWSRDTFLAEPEFEKLNLGALITLRWLLDDSERPASLETRLRQAAEGR